MVRILVTGGAGFIGSHLTDTLVKKGHEVTVFDNLEPQVHQGKKPTYLNPDAAFIEGDVLDKEKLKAAVLDADVVYHEAAMVGVGQSMYEIARYMDANAIGTSHLLDILVNEEHDVKKLVVAASMSSYGEGAYVDADGNPYAFHMRPEAQLSAKQFEPVDAKGGKLTAVPTSEEKLQDCNSIYAISKKVQEDMVLNIGRSYGIPSVALRYFNAIGPRQSLSNPYTGVAAIFMSRIKNGNRPTIFEDGLQTRDFVSVHDIVQANVLAMEGHGADYESVNVGTGKPTSILKVAQVIAQLYGSDVIPEVTSRFRKGDIRHCYADISKIQRLLGFEPKVSFTDAMKEIITWSDTVEANDTVDEATAELEKKGLIV